MIAPWLLIRQKLDGWRRDPVDPVHGHFPCTPHSVAGVRRHRPRWSVCFGGYPNGWEEPIAATDDPALATAYYELAIEVLRATHARWRIVAIFDDNGEGEPLDPDRVREKLADSEI